MRDARSSRRLLHRRCTRPRHRHRVRAAAAALLLRVRFREFAPSPSTSQGRTARPRPDARPAARQMRISATRCMLLVGPRTGDRRCERHQPLTRNRGGGVLRQQREQRFPLQRGRAEVGDRLRNGWQQTHLLTLPWLRPAPTPTDRMQPWSSRRPAFAACAPPHPCAPWCARRTCIPAR